MKTNIGRILYSQLHNDEFALAAVYTIDISGKYDNEALHLGKSYAELVAFRPVLESLKVYERKSAKIARLGKLDVERDILLGCLNKSVKSFEDIDLPEISGNHEKLSALLDKHKTKTIAADNRTAETERLQKLEADINASAEIQSAITAFGLQPVINRLFTANKEYDVLFREYIAEKSTEERIDVVDLRKQCTKAIGQYIDAVQYCAFAYEDLDYTPLINELQQLSAYYNQQIKTRATRRKNGKTADEETTIEPPK
jgi:hypothetical protein